MRLRLRSRRKAREEIKIPREKGEALTLIKRLQLLDMTRDFTTS